MPRIVSLIASATEIVAALGFEDQIVGRSHECDYPESVQRLPICTEPKFPVSGSSGEIDRHVKSVLQNALSVYRVDADKLKELRPDVIVTQSHCEVCAVSERDVESALRTWLDGRPRIVSLVPNALADLWKDIGLVADALDFPEAGGHLVNELQNRMEKIAGKTRPLAGKPTVACIEWIDPLMVAGNWMPELVEMAGGVNLFGTAGKHSPRMTWEEFRQRDPDIIAVMPCGFDIARSERDMPVLEAKPGWSELQAVGAGRVFLTDGNSYFNRPGPRLVESLEILAELFHPNVFRFGHEGTGWRRWRAG